MPKARKTFEKGWDSTLVFLQLTALTSKKLASVTKKSSLELFFLISCLVQFVFTQLTPDIYVRIILGPEPWIAGYTG